MRKRSGRLLKKLHKGSEDDSSGSSGPADGTPSSGGEFRHSSRSSCRPGPGSSSLAPLSHGPPKYLPFSPFLLTVLSSIPRNRSGNSSRTISFPIESLKTSQRSSKPAATPGTPSPMTPDESSPSALDPGIPNLN